MKLYLKKMLPVSVAALCGLVISAKAQSPESVYTSLSSKQCKTLKVYKEGEGSVQSCAGVGGYRLLVEEGDLRTTITVVAPSGRKHPLQYWQVVTNAFSTVGEKAEWRVIKIKGKLVPTALIVRVNASENTENSEKITSYLAVAKIIPQKICVTNKINPGATQNEEARSAADSSANSPCLQGK
jgi:hypothetical protein